MAYDNTNSGALFKNGRKEKETHPDYNGQLTVKCPCCEETTEFWLSAWLKTAGAAAKNPGQKFFSIAINPKDDTKVGGKTVRNSQPPEEDFDDIPF